MAYSRGSLFEDLRYKINASIKMVSMERAISSGAGLEQVDGF